MVRAALLAVLSCGCTLLVDHQLASNPGGCGELPFDDGAANGGQRFHAGVTAPSFRGAAFPPPGKAPENFGATLAFIADGGVELAGGYLGDTVFLRPETNYSATSASTTPGHEGPGGFGCAEVVAATYDTLHDRTSLQLISGGCGDDAITYDGGTFAGAPAAISPGLAWAGAAGDGGVFAAVMLARGQTCPESFPPTCFPPDGGTVAAGGARRMDALIDAQGQPAWVVSTEGSDVRLYDSTFRASIGVVSWSGPIAVLAPDIGIALRIQAGELQAQLFDATGSKRGAEAHTSLGDAAAHGLEIARFGTAPVVRAAWIGGDGRARVATYDATVAAAQTLSKPAVVCGSQGASFVAPLSSTTAAVLVGEALYLRHVD